MAKPNVKAFALATVSKFLWLTVLVPILTVSAYSFYWISRHWGVPPPFAILMSTCFDGVTLLSAEYSLRYAQEGMSGTLPRTMVRLFALIAAYLQAFHARLGHEPTGGMVLWAALPIAAVVVYEIHIRWERRRALARVGVLYPAPLPSFGAITWLLFPFATLTSLREIVEKRKQAILTSALARASVTATVPRDPKPVTERTEKPGKPARKPAKLPSNVRTISFADSHAPKRHMRAWLQERDYPVGVSSRIAMRYQEIHNRECKECNPGADREEASS